MEVSFGFVSGTNKLPISIIYVCTRFPRIAHSPKRIEQGHNSQKADLAYQKL